MKKAIFVIDTGEKRQPSRARLVTSHPMVTYKVWLDDRKKKEK